MNSRNIAPFTHEFFATYAENAQGREMATHAATTFMVVAEAVANATPNSDRQPPIALGEPDPSGAVMGLAQSALEVALEGRECRAVPFSRSAPYPKPGWMSDGVYEDSWSEEQTDRRRTALRLAGSLGCERLERERSSGGKATLSADPMVGRFLDLEEDVDDRIGHVFDDMEALGPAIGNAIGYDRAELSATARQVGVSRIVWPHDVSLLLRSVARQCAVAALKGRLREYERLCGLIRLLPQAVILGRLDCAKPKYVFLVA